MWPFLLLLIPIGFGIILCYNFCNGIQPADRMWVTDERYGGLKNKKL